MCWLLRLWDWDLLNRLIWSSWQWWILLQLFCYRLSLTAHFGERTFLLLWSLRCTDVMRAVQFGMSVLVSVECRRSLFMRKNTAKWRLFRSALTLNAWFDWERIGPHRMCALWGLFLRVRLNRWFWVLRLDLLVSRAVFHLSLEFAVKVVLMIFALDSLNLSFDMDLVFGHFGRVIGSVYILIGYDSALRVGRLAS